QHIDLDQRDLPFFDPSELQTSTGFSPEAVSDGADELEEHGMVRLTRTIGSGPFRFAILQPTYALVYTFHDHVKQPFDPQEDIRMVTATIAALENADGSALSARVPMPAARINLAVSYLSDYGVIRVLKALGTGPFNFAIARATVATRPFVKEYCWQDSS